MIDIEAYRIQPGQRLNLPERESLYCGGLKKADAVVAFDNELTQLVRFQQMLYAQQKHAVLVVLQAMDAGGKDSTIRHVFGPINPQGCRVSCFKVPSPEEAAHDYLWRVHMHAPARGMIGVFNRSHYESVLVERVKGLTPALRWEKRFDHINAFEKLLWDEGTTIVKFFLHISKGYQRMQLQERLDDPDKHWKFNPDDLAERGRWDAYMEALGEALSRCSTPHAPWYVVPAERKWFRNLLVARVMAETMKGLGLAFPKPQFNPSAIKID